MIEDYMYALFNIPKELYTSMYISNQIPLKYATLIVSLIVAYFFSRNFQGYKKHSTFVIFGFMFYTTMVYWMRL